MPYGCVLFILPHMHQVLLRVATYGEFMAMVLLSSCDMWVGESGYYPRTGAVGF